MPNLQKFRDFHYDATVKVSDNARTFALAGVAVIWFFREQIDGRYLIPLGLRLPLMLIIFSLALDFIQHVYRAIAWHIIFRSKEKSGLEKGGIDETAELYVPPSVNYVAYACFYSKVVTLSVAYFLLMKFFWFTVVWA